MFTYSFAIRGALLRIVEIVAWNPACASWTFGWLPFADHQAVMIGSACAA